jgi:hypothetical protein
MASDRVEGTTESSGSTAAEIAARMERLRQIAEERARIEAERKAEIARQAEAKRRQEAMADKKDPRIIQGTGFDAKKSGTGNKYLPDQPMPMTAEEQKDYRTAVTAVSEKEGITSEQAMKVVDGMGDPQKAARVKSALKAYDETNTPLVQLPEGAVVTAANLKRDTDKKDTSLHVTPLSQVGPDAGVRLGNSTVGSIGCFVTATAMAVNTIKGFKGKDLLTPKDIVATGHFVGNSLDQNGAVGEYGLSAVRHDFADIKGIQDSLAKGHPVVVGVSKFGGEANSHFVTITGIGKDDNGRTFYKALDPLSKDPGSAGFKFYQEGNELKGTWGGRPYSVTSTRLIVGGANGEALVSGNFKSAPPGSTDSAQTYTNSSGGTSSYTPNSGGDGGPVSATGGGTAAQHAAVNVADDYGIDWVELALIAQKVAGDKKVQAYLEVDKDFQDFARQFKGFENWKPGMKLSKAQMKELEDLKVLFLTDKIAAKAQAQAGKDHHVSAKDLKSAAEQIHRKYGKSAAKDFRPSISP